MSGPPPDPSTIEAAKPRDFRNINVVVNSVNTGIALGERPGITAGRGRGHARFGGRGQLLSNNPDQAGPKQIADRPWDAPGGQGLLGQPQPAPQPPPSGSQNLSGNQNRPSILAAVGQQDLPYGF